MKKFTILFILLFTLLNAQELNNKNFNKVIKSHKLVLVDFWQPHCPGCEMLKPHFNRAKRVMGNRVLFATYNVRQFGDPVRRYQIYSTPTMVLFKDGVEVDRNYMLSTQDIITWLKAYVK